MKSVAIQLAEYLKSVSPSHVASGDLQRHEWRNKNGSLATPRSIVRRLEELVEDGTLKVEIKNGHAFYYWGDKKKLVWMGEPIFDEKGKCIARRMVQRELVSNLEYI